MTLRAITPAPLAELVALWSRDSFARRWQASASILQAARSDSIGWYDGDHLIAAALFYPVREDLSELVFCCRPEAKKHMLSIVRTARLTAAALPHDVTIRALCRRDNHAGRRFTWLCGLRPAGIDGGFKRYELRASAHGQLRQRHQVAVRR